MSIIISRTDPPVTSESIDFTHSDGEPIQYVQAIQPHGVLLIVEEPRLRIVQYSTNAADFLGLAPANWHNQTLDRLLGEDNTRAIRAALTDKHLDQAYLYLLTLTCLAQPDSAFHLFANRSDGLLLLELERADVVSGPGRHIEWHTFHNALTWLKQPGQLQTFLQRATATIKTLTGFERVMIYRFKPDVSGHIVAESLEPGLEPYENLHFPVGDIPLPARRILQLTHFRFMPDVDYEPVPLRPHFSEAGLERPVDLGFSSLRSASTGCHHHSTTHYLAYPDRVYASLFVQAIARSIQDHENLEYETYRRKLRDSLSIQIDQAGCHVDLYFSAAMVANMNLLAALNADGVAISIESTVILQGHTPVRPWSNN